MPVVIYSVTSVFPVVYPETSHLAVHFEIMFTTLTLPPKFIMSLLDKFVTMCKYFSYVSRKEFWKQRNNIMDVHLQVTAPELPV
jgi:hypothetical protein